jgi:lipopolysaccharide export system protein LptC
MDRRDFHSRLVGWLKVALPLAALAILSTLFLLSDRIDPNAAIPYAEVDVEDLARDPRMTAPAYAGTTEDGTGITLSATEAHPAGSDSDAVATGVLAVLETPDGQRIDISAARAELDPATRRLRLDQGVSLATASGYRIETEAMEADLARTHVESTLPVRVVAPMGALDAGGFELTQDPAAPSGYLLVFKGGVKLVYQPGGQTP